MMEGLEKYRQESNLLLIKRTLVRTVAPANGDLSLWQQRRQNRASSLIPVTDRGTCTATPRERHSSPHLQASHL